MARGRFVGGWEEEVEVKVEGLLRFLFLLLIELQVTCQFHIQFGIAYQLTLSRMRAMMVVRA